MTTLDLNQIQALASDLRAVSDVTYPAKNVIADDYTSLHGYEIGEYCLRNGLLYKCNTAISSSGEAWNSNHWDENNIGNNIGNKVLYFSNVAVASASGDIVDYSNGAIDTNHIVVSCTFANPNYIYTDMSWSTSSGRVVINSACSSATTCDLLLIRKDN